MVHFRIRSTGPTHCGSNKVDKLFFYFDLVLIDGGGGRNWNYIFARMLCKKHNIISIAQVCEVKVEVDAEAWAALKYVCEPVVTSDVEESGGSNTSLANSWGGGKWVGNIAFGPPLQLIFEYRFCRILVYLDRTKIPSRRYQRAFRSKSKSCF